MGQNLKLHHRFTVLGTIVIVCVIVDQWTKRLAMDKLSNAGTLSYLADTFRFQYTENNGAFLSLGAALPDGARFWLLTVAVGIFLGGLVFYLVVTPGMVAVQLVALSLIAAGGVGNMIDRVAREGSVVDFMNIGIGSLRSGVFNVADMAITFGFLWLMWMQWRSGPSDATSSAGQTTAGSAASSPNHDRPGV